MLENKCSTNAISSSCSTNKTELELIFILKY